MHAKALLVTEKSIIKTRAKNTALFFMINLLATRTWLSERQHGVMIFNLVEASASDQGKAVVEDSQTTV